MMANLPNPLRGPRGLAAGALLLVSPRVLRLPRSVSVLARLTGAGLLAVAMAAGDRLRAAPPGDDAGGESATPAPPATPGGDAPGGRTANAADAPAQRGSAAGAPGSTTERPERDRRAERDGRPGEGGDAEVIRQRTNADDEFVGRQESAAAAAARSIGGPALNDADADPAMDPVYEAGGGEAEGYELAERDLIRNATHDVGRADPEGDSYVVEAEVERSTAEYGEPDQLRSIEGDQSGTGQDEGPDRV
jgi:hypothetical protein